MIPQVPIGSILKISGGTIPVYFKLSKITARRAYGLRVGPQWPYAPHPNIERISTPLAQCTVVQLKGE